MASPAPCFIDLDFARLELHEHFVLGTVHEGIVFDQPHFEKFHEIFKQHFHDRPFGYISNRLNDYTINPTLYATVDQYNFNIVGVATLCYSDTSYQNALFAERFLKFPHKAFFKKSDCVSWIERQLKNAGL